MRLETLIGGQPIPFHGFDIVLKGALAEGVPNPEIVLCCGLALIGGQPIPA